MKLIIQRTHGRFYAYRESEKQFKRVEPDRGTERLDTSMLDVECDLSQYGNFHMVFDVKKGSK